MRLDQWDPQRASEAELASWLAAYNASRAADLPDDPLWRSDRLRDYLSVTMPDETWVMWLAHAQDGSVAGYGGLLMQAGMGVVELFVAPEHRGQGLGRSFLRAIAQRAVHSGFTSLGVEVAGNTPGVAFYQRHGFTHVYTETRSLLDLTTVDWDSVAEMASGFGYGYRIDFYPYDLPDSLLDTYAQAKQVLRTHPNGDLDLRPSSYDPDRLRASLRCLRSRGLDPYIVVAVHERSETIAALTELVVPAQHPTRADQYDTVVLPQHASYGLGRAIKARMLLELRRTQPRLRHVQTWQGNERDHLRHINRELGFVDDRPWLEFQTDGNRLLARMALQAGASGTP